MGDTTYTSAASESAEIDVVVIGAASKCYLDFHSDATLLILDRDNCVGGTWNSREFFAYQSISTHFNESKGGDMIPSGPNRR
ncbi:cofactor FMO1 FAD enzyme protein [Rutstroemia sp. NJR-2017a WRK4]|nr:cofactor FMO1 FAD enzyme protein [Rutstroemia sp. NJR-2017a WRK4]